MKHFILPLLFVSFLFVSASAQADGVFRLGIIGTDTSHVPAFVKLFNDPNAEGDYQKFQVVGAYKGGMPDNESSWSRKDGYANDIAPLGVKVYDTIEEMLANVDGVLIESVDGRPHLEFAKPVIAAGKPFFVDKPMAGNLWEVLEIFRLAEEKNVPFFSASSLRYSEGMRRVREDSPFGETHGVDAWSPCHLNEFHPDFYWYGIHGVETLFTMMGPGCVSVSRTSTPNYDVAVGVWENGKIGVFRGQRAGAQPYGGMVFGSKGADLAGKYDGYKPLCDEICKFFLTGKTPIEPRETLEIMAFMTAADVSKTLNGQHVTLESVIEEAKNLNAQTFTVTLGDADAITIDGKPVTLEELGKTLTEPNAQTYYRVILENPAGVSGEKLTAVLKGLGAATLVRYIY